MKTKYDDNVLIKLRRDYKENETIIYTLNKVFELKERNQKLCNEINKVRVENKKLKYSRQPKNEIDLQKEKIKTLQEEIRVLKIKNGSLHEMKQFISQNKNILIRLKSEIVNLLKNVEIKEMVEKKFDKIINTEYQTKERERLIKPNM